MKLLILATLISICLGLGCSRIYDNILWSAREADRLKRREEEGEIQLDSIAVTQPEVQLAQLK